jgi:predicted metal-dependent peptidase
MDDNSLLSKVSKQLMFKEPFYGLFLVRLKKEFRNSVSTMKIVRNDFSFALQINPDYFRSLTDDQRRVRLKHELLHMALFHTKLGKEARFLGDARTFGIAADIEVNQWLEVNILPYHGTSQEDFAKIRQDYINDLNTKKDSIESQEFYRLRKLAPVRPITLDDMPFKNETKKGAVWYYNKLKSLMGPDKENPDNEIPFQISMNPESAQWDEIDNEHEWKDFSDMSDTEIDIMERQLFHTLNEVAQSVKGRAGSIPGEFEEILKNLEPEPPKFDWRGYIRKFAGTSEGYDFSYSRRKLNKRFAGNPGRRVNPGIHICFCIDTSASVSTDELLEVQNELRHIQKLGAKVTLVHCDTDIAKVEPLPKGPIKIYGRGGTRFEPSFDYYNEHYKKEGFTCMIYFTDGEAQVPSFKCMGKVLWVLSSRSNWNSALEEVGTVIQLN